MTSVGRPRPDTANGVELENYRIPGSLAAQGHQVLLACITPHVASPVPGAEVRAYPPRKFGSIPADLKTDVLSWKPDVAIVTSVYTPFNNRLAAWVNAQGIPYIVRPNGGYGRLNERLHRWRKRIYKYVFELPMLNRAKFVWAVGDHDDVREYGTRAPVVETPRGMDLPNVEPGGRTEVACLEGLADKFVFGFVGRLEPTHKGLDLAVASFDLLDDQDSFFVIVGPTESRTAKSFIADTQHLQSHGRIRFAGGLYGDDRDRFLGSIDAFLHPSRWEGGVPNSVIQAASMGRPLIITRHADPSELLQEQRACIRVELEIDSIVRGMRLVRSMSATERLELGQRAAEAVSSAFSWDRMVDAFHDGMRVHGLA